MPEQSQGRFRCMFKKCKGIILWVCEILLVPLRLANAVMLTLAGAWIKEFCGYVEKAISMPLSDGIKGSDPSV